MPERLDALRAALAGRYEIDKEVGRGGMATVYLAKDLRHNRDVAVKVLRPDLAAALGHERFLREIEIAAKLTHPHILPLHDSGEADGFLYYVMPYIAGDTLRDRVEKEGELPIGEAVRIIREVTDALAFAHSQGVVHRDIKPDNVMLAGRHAMVTDFGVAKAVSEATGRSTLTTAGVALGTPTYMAPEQATADPHVDHRADIYAVGIMAYELLAGRTPFQGVSPQAVLAAHVTEQAEPVTKHRDQVPAELEAVVMRCLAKKPADRWQSADEMLPLLETMATSSGGITPTDTRPLRADGNGRPRRFWWMASGAVAVLAVIAVYGAVTRDEPLIITASNMVSVTNDVGIEFQPALSPDGREVAYAIVDPTEPWRIGVKSTINIAGGGQGHPADGVPGSQGRPQWTADGTSLRFSACSGTLRCTWHVVDRMGGVVQPVELPDSLPTDRVWSPDGRRVVSAHSAGLIVRSTDHRDSVLLEGPDENRVLHSFSWSPDGSRIAYVNGNPYWRWRGNSSASSIWVIDATGGEPVRVTDEDHMDVSPVWLPDGRHLLFVSNRNGPRGIYVVEVGPNGPVGEPRPLSGPADPHSISLSADGKKLAFSRFTWVQNVRSIPIPRTGAVSVRTARPVTTGTQVVETHNISPDRDWIAFDSDRLGNTDIYRMPLGGGRPQLVADLPGYAFAPAWSPDGTEIAFYGYGGTPGGANEVWVVASGGGTPTVLTSGPGVDQNPVWSPDGLSLAYLSSGLQLDGGYAIWAISRDHVGGSWGEPKQLSEVPCILPDWAPDGRLLCILRSDIIVLSREGHVVDRLSLASEHVVLRARFSADGRTIFFLSGGAALDAGQAVWSLPVTGGEPTLLVFFDDPAWTAFYDMSVDEDYLYLTIVERNEMDVWVADLSY